MKPRIRTATIAASMLGALLLTGLIAPATSAASTTDDSLPVVTNLRVIGADSEGFPVITGDTVPADSTYNNWTAFWKAHDPADHDWYTSVPSRRPHDTMYDAAYWCIPSGTYDLTLWRSMGNGPSNTITVTLPANPATGE